MSSRQLSDPDLWRRGLALLERAWGELPAAERAWILPRIEAIARLQQGMQQLFAAGAGDGHCARCRGACCARGKHHLTLVNLLGFLAAGEPLPVADFTASCPMLGGLGCQLAAARRPFNCVTFVCETIESAMGEEAGTAFYAAERALRQLYRQFELRYAGAGMRGFLLAVARLDGTSPLRRIDLAAGHPSPGPA